MSDGTVDVSETIGFDLASDSPPGLTAIGASRAVPALAEPIAGTLFFAGEATHDRLSGTVAGAIASGYRAADEVLQTHRPAS